MNQLMPFPALSSMSSAPPVMATSPFTGLRQPTMTSSVVDGCTRILCDGQFTPRNVCAVSALLIPMAGTELVDDPPDVACHCCNPGISNVFSMNSSSGE